MLKSDKELFLKMTRSFYNSESVLFDIPEQFHLKTFNEMMKSDQYLTGYILMKDRQPAGYALTSKYYSHEAGGLTLFVDELYVLRTYRSLGLGKEFFNYLKNNLDEQVVRLRLEVESENTGAINLYSKEGFSFLKYKQMIMDI